MCIFKSALVLGPAARLCSPPSQGGCALPLLESANSECGVIEKPQHWATRPASNAAPLFSVWNWTQGKNQIRFFYFLLSTRSGAEVKRSQTVEGMTKVSRNTRRLKESEELSTLPWCWNYPWPCALSSCHGCCPVGEIKYELINFNWNPLTSRTTTQKCSWFSITCAAVVEANCRKKEEIKPRSD